MHGKARQGDELQGTANLGYIYRGHSTDSYEKSRCGLVSKDVWLACRYVMEPHRRCGLGNEKA
jgi:hypothetical protein